MAADQPTDEARDTAPDPSLPDPPDLEGAKQSVELASAWIIDGALHVTVRPEVLDDPAQWGVVLADVALQVAESLDRETNLDYDDLLDDIVDVFMEELDGEGGDDDEDEEDEEDYDEEDEDDEDEDD